MPLGKYPQLRLCGQLGIAPINIRINMISKMVPSDMVMLRLVLMSALAHVRLLFFLPPVRCFVLDEANKTMDLVPLHGAN